MQRTNDTTELDFICTQSLSIAACNTLLDSNSNCEYKLPDNRLILISSKDDIRILIFPKRSSESKSISLSLSFNFIDALSLITSIVGVHNSVAKSNHMLLLAIRAQSTTKAILQDDKQFSHSKLEKRVETLFDRIQEEFTSPLTEEQLTTLHCFLTVCYEKMHIDPIKYRNILISYANNSSV